MFIEENKEIEGEGNKNKKTKKIFNFKDHVWTPPKDMEKIGGPKQI